MEKIENNKVKESLYKETLENGLIVMVIPRKGVRQKYIIFGTNFGSIDNTFVLPGETEEKTVPDGIAHFLEHKMFEQRSGVNNFYEALDEFMDYVQNPYYTDENVEKEKGIIAQEINMYEDYPEWQTYLNAIKCMYKDFPVRLDIAGSVESITGITKEQLYLCYDNFYTPSNMAIAVCRRF